jgi:hypothetical protein
MRSIIAAAVILASMGVTISQAQAPSSGYTPRGYRYDTKTCAAGYQTCFNSHLKMGWHNAASGTYCQQACGVFPPQSSDRHNPW